MKTKEQAIEFLKTRGIEDSQISDLLVQFANPEQPYKRWRAKKDETYYYINYINEIHYDTDLYCKADDYRYMTGNYHQTGKLAEKARDKQLARQKIIDHAGDQSWIDWGDGNQEKHYLIYNFRDEVWEVWIIYIWREGEFQTWYKTREEAEQAMKELKPELDLFK